MYSRLREQIYYGLEYIHALLAVQLAVQLYRGYNSLGMGNIVGGFISGAWSAMDAQLFDMKLRQNSFFRPM